MTEATRTQMIPRLVRYFETQPVKKVWLFGSYARGEECDESDVDLLVQLDYSQRIGLRYFGMYEDLKSLLGRSVDLVSEPFLKSFASQTVNRDKVLVYERA
jgi:predicted nucleotidyltransferase